MAAAAKIAGLPAATIRAVALTAAGPWRRSAERRHGAVAAALLSGTSLLGLASPLANGTMLAWGGALLLIGGALIGVPHGTSDIVVGHRILRPVLGRRWLPCFLVVYLALVGVTMAAWATNPGSRSRPAAYSGAKNLNTSRMRFFDASSLVGRCIRSIL